MLVKGPLGQFCLRIVYADAKSTVSCYIFFLAEYVDIELCLDIKLLETPF